MRLSTSSLLFVAIATTNPLLFKVSSFTLPQLTVSSSSSYSTRNNNNNNNNKSCLYESAGNNVENNNNNNKSNNNNENNDEFVSELKEVLACGQIVTSAIFKNSKSITPEDIVAICDALDNEAKSQDNSPLFVTSKLQLRTKALQTQRYEMLAKLLQSDYKAYVATASFLSPSRIPRNQLPNVQDVPFDKTFAVVPETKSEGDVSLVPDCELPDLKYQDNVLDKLLLFIFRKLVTKNTGGVTSDVKGIKGLVEQGRAFLLKPGQTPEAQHKMVRDTLSGLMTPVLPPFYRLFMSGIIPQFTSNNNDDSTTTKELPPKQLGPWFYAPYLTSVVTPTFFGFLVGPSTPNRRKDGQLGGLVVEKCKFLQESGCKGLCLHQCKLPAQQFFKDELGLSLTVTPNFVTQECQWSFGEEPLPPSEDPMFPQGCLVGCESRKLLVSSGSRADVCN